MQSPPPHPPDVTLAILAGGASRRLGGAPKGLLQIDGSSILERLLTLRPLVAQVLLATTDPAPYADFGLTSVADPIRGKGAPGGLLAALEAATTPWVLAVGCDMPFVTAPVVERLLRARGPEVDAVCFEVAHRLEPLLAVYRSALHSRFREALSGAPSLTGLLVSVRTCVLPEQALVEVDPQLRSVVGVNTSEEANAVGASLPLAAMRRLP